VSSFAKGKHAWGICDRTGFRYPLGDLVYEIENGVPNGLRVGRDVVDQDHPQNHLDKTDTHDPQGLEDPRPDTAVEGLFGWNPTGNPADYIRILSGKVGVVT
jgi:hypothetical protein